MSVSTFTAAGRARRIVTDETADRAVGKNVRRARLAAELTRGECAATIDIPLEAFRACEGGRERLSLQQLSTLGELLSVPVETFFEKHAHARAAVDKIVRIE